MTSFRLLNEESNSPPVYSIDREEASLDFVTTPYRAETVSSLGTVSALDSFLQTIAVLPLRASSAVLRGRWRSIDCISSLIMAATFRVLQHVNTSSIYHSVRGQAGITMFVSYSLTEVCDKFSCSIGHEIAACLTSERSQKSRKRLIAYATVNFLYMSAHSFVLMWQLVTLNLAVNSFSNSSSSFILTNSFSEIKAAVFKKFDSDSSFQLVCTDITQRFQYFSLLSVVVSRNLLEYWLAVGGPWYTTKASVAILGPTLIVGAALVSVDWLKIAYIINFNNLSSAKSFNGFSEALRNDYRSNIQRPHQSLVSKQAGLPVTPLVIVWVRMFAKGGVIMSPVTPVLFVILLGMKSASRAYLEHIAKDPEPKTEEAKKAQ